MFFNGWYSLYRVVIVSVACYVALNVILRISGKRTLSKMTAYDFVVTVALGSILATAITSKDVSIAEGITALAVLCGLQYVASWLFVRSRTLEDWAKAEPSLLVYKQVYLQEVMRKVRVTERDVLSAITSQGTHWENVEAVILQADGSLAVVSSGNSSDNSKIYSIVNPSPSSVANGSNNGE